MNRTQQLADALEAFSLAYERLNAARLNGCKVDEVVALADLALANHRANKLLNAKGLALSPQDDDRFSAFAG